MNRLSSTILVLVFATGSGCSSETENVRTSSISDLSKRESTMIIIEEPSINNEKSDSESPDRFELTEKEKAILKKSVEQVQAVISISKEITDNDTAIYSIEKLREARNSLQKIREEFRITVSNSHRRFRIFATEEGKELQAAMWTMKKELHRLEQDEEIQTIIADGMGTESVPVANSNTARDERKKFTVTASNTTTSAKPADDNNSKSDSTLVVSEEIAP